MMKNHVKAVTTMDEVDIVALCDVVRERAEAVAEIFPDAFITTDYRELTDKVDAVLVALPHDLHYECGMYFAKKKSTCLWKSPFAIPRRSASPLLKPVKKRVLPLCALTPFASGRAL